MKSKIMMIVVFTLALTTRSAFSYLMGTFQGWDKLEEQSSVIAIVYTQNTTPRGTLPLIGNAPSSDWQLDILSTLKGTNTVSSTRFLTDHELKNNCAYLVFGEYDGTALRAIEDFRVVQLDNGLSLDSLKGKTLDEQLQILFQRAVDDMNQKIEDEEKEKDRLQEGVLQYQGQH
jgi:hypothetical protein